MTFANLCPGSSLRALYRARRLLTTLAVVGALAAAAGGATYALGADIVRDAATQQDR